MLTSVLIYTGLFITGLLLCFSVFGLLNAIRHKRSLTQ